MRAIFIRETGGPEQLELREAPTPEVRASEVRVHVHYAGINRVDILQRRGLYGRVAGADQDRPGIEFAGVVEQVGDACRRFQRGQHVMGLVAGGAYADYVVIHEDELLPVPAGVHLREAAALPEAILTAYDAIWLQGHLPEQGWCLVRAATSGVGLAACQLLRAFGGHAVATTRSRERAGRLAAVRPEAVVVDGEDDLLTTVKRVTGGAGVDVTLDLVGGAEFTQGLEALRHGGTLMLVGILAGNAAKLELAPILRKRLRIQGTVLRSRDHAARAALAERFRSDIAPLFDQGALRPIIDSEFPLADAGKAHAHIEANQHFGKVLLAL